MKLKKSVAILAASLAVAHGYTFAEEMEEEVVVVIGQRAMMQNAISRQKDSDLVKSILTRDAIGQFPDQNVAEAVRRLTGVNVLNDQGEGRFIAVRGLDPSLNAASINGTRIPAPESDTRSVALDVIASELIESIEVIKTLTPDMDADTIGASIRINTVNAFQAEKPSLNLKVEGSYNDLNEETSPKIAADFIYPISEDFGVSGGISYHDRDTSTDNIEAEGWDITDTGILYADAIEYRDYDVNRERIGGNVSFDFRVSDNTSVYARAIYSVFDDTEQRRRLVFEMDEEPTSGTSSSATFLSDDGEISVRRGLKDRYESQKIASYQFGGETETGDWRFEYEASFSHAEEHETNTQDPTRFREDFDSAGALAVTFNYADMTLPTYSIGAGSADFNNPATFGFNKIELVDGLAEDDENAFKLDITRTLALSDGILDIKFGGKYRARTKEFDLTLQVLDDFNGSYDLSDVVGSQSYGLANLGPLPDLDAVRAFNAANRANFELNALDTQFESNVEDFKVDEDILAGYAMARWESGPMTVIGGLRVERTENTVSANLVELVEEDGTHNGVVLTEDTVFITPNSFDKDYTDVLPSASIRYEMSEDVILRGGVFKSVVRPKISSLAPRFIVEEADDGEREGEFGNPDLEPYEAWNFDISAEYYMSADAVIQAGFFHKTIDNFIVDVEFDSGDAPYNGVFNGVAFDEAVIPLNGDEADVTGLEFNYQQALTSLPGPFDGLIVGFNYTYTDSEGTINGRNIPLPASSENNYNATLGYEKGPISVRLTAAYRDSYLDELGDDAEEDRYVEDHLQWDLTAKYSVTENVRLYAQFVNLGDEPYVAYQPGPGANRLLQYEEYSWTGKFGVQVNF